MISAVADNGPGIPGARRQDVLRRFVRLDASRQEPGTGLGLSVVHAIVRHHHADLLLEDHRPGLRLSIRLPITNV
ncbi:MAG: sensor histidine kinase [Magnetospirillum sp.]|nr:sensor histidine kinase [Magnetospirillum sp.]